MRALSKKALEKDILREDKKNCRKIGPCGIGKKAVYVNGFYISRKYYIPIDSIERVFKRVAMSQGGFSGQGAFASIPYFVVVYDGGKGKQCIFKREEEVDEILKYMKQYFPHIPTVSAAAEKKIAQQAAKKKKETTRKLSKEEENEIRKLENARMHLEKRPELYKNLTETAKKKRAFEQSNPMYRWIAFSIVILGAVAAVYGIWAIVTDRSYAMYFLLFGLSAVLLFARANVFPTKKNSLKYMEDQWNAACQKMENHLKLVQKFPVPARYAHPSTLARMINIIKKGKADTCEKALEVLKEDLKRLNADVQVAQEEYDEIMSIKPMFLVENYR